VLINSQKESELALKVAEEIVGTPEIDPEYLPSMASEDFSFMLNETARLFYETGLRFY
tara:strand:+ start:98 stop:271 length:174 start_codon:yes stop_codon:yes gene_type:complete